MEVSVRRLGRVTVIAPAGRVDHLNAEAFRSLLAPHLASCAAGGECLILDLSRLEYISSAGLRILMIAAKQVGAQRGRIVVAAMQPVVAEIFEISRFTLVYEVFATLPEALSALDAETPVLEQTV